MSSASPMFHSARAMKPTTRHSRRSRRDARSRFGAEVTVTNLLRLSLARGRSLRLNGSRSSDGLTVMDGPHPAPPGSPRSPRAPVVGDRHLGRDRRGEVRIEDDRAGDDLVADLGAVGVAGGHDSSLAVGLAVEKGKSPYP